MNFLAEHYRHILFVAGLVATGRLVFRSWLSAPKKPLMQDEGNVTSPGERLGGELPGKIVHVTSTNQMGGQTAQTIVNIGAQRRVLEDAQFDLLVAEFAAVAGKAAIFVSELNNHESIAFSDQLETAARAGGVVVAQSVMAVHSGPVSGVQIQFPSGDPVLRASAEKLQSFLSGLGFLARVDAGKNDGVLVIIVGSNNRAVQW